MNKLFNPNEIKKWDIYVIENPLGQIYVGCSCRFNGRLSRYRNHNVPHQKRVQESLETFGFYNHKINIIETFESDHQYAKGKEIFWIRTYMSNYAKFPEMNGLNKSMGGGIADFLRTPEAISKSKKVFTDNPQLLIDRGKKISKSKMGHYVSKQTKDKISVTKRAYSKPIEQYTIDGKFVARYDCYTDAVNGSGAGKATVWGSLNNKLKSLPRKYIFKYA